MERQSIKKLLGITEHDEIIYVDSFHWNGVSCNSFTPVSKEDIELRNDIDNLKDNYGYLWQESVAQGTTEESLNDFIDAIVEQSEASGQYFVGHDDSHIYDITEDDKELIATHFNIDPEDIETFECIGVGTEYISNIKLKTVFNQELYDQALAHCNSKK